ncbi:hypothetical protein F5Y14DRAFT_433376 [Nemania sp. NC0429]|nr:hypothetical protein F5Y14DRAFT_433376 [Nemania sp. NC0429]
MARVITYYQETDMEPWATIDWKTIKSFLWVGYDMRWAGGKKQAEDCIHGGVKGDVLAVFESFPHFIWNLMQAKKINVTDNAPFVRPREFGNVHNNLYLCLTTYAEHLGDTHENRNEKWKLVETCLQKNGFNNPDNQAAICEAVYDALAKFVINAWGIPNAMVIAKANREMRFHEEKVGFGKRGNSDIPALDFSPQMWLVNSDGNNSGEGDKTVKIQRGIRAIFKLVAGEIQSAPPSKASEDEIPYYLSHGATVQLHKAEKPQSSKPLERL